MTIQIQLAPSAESTVAELARMKGLPLNEYVQGLLESLAIPTLPVPNEKASEDAADALRDWASQFPYRRVTSLPDQAISRENIYRRAGNQ